MTLRTKVYVGIILSLGALTLALQIPHLSIEHPVRFIVYSSLAAMASLMKVKIPGVEGNISVLFVLLLIGIVELSLPETLIIGAGSVFVQSFFAAQRRPRLVQLTFNMASLMIAIRLATLAYTLPLFQNLYSPTFWRLAVTAVVFFLANTFPVALVIAFSENKPLSQTWQRCYFWSFPYYLAGAAIAGLASITTQAGGWPTVLLFLPLLYGMYRSYCLYLDRLKAETALAEQMRSAAARVTSVLESTSDCVLAVSHESKIIYLNERARARFSAGKQLEGMYLAEALPEIAGTIFGELCQKAANEKAPANCEQFFPKLKAWFDVHFYPSPDGVAIYLREITEQRELQEQLRQSQKMEAVGRLAGGVAHDFNNLLTIIIGYSHQLMNVLPAGKLRQDAREILNAGERATALTQQLLAFSRKQVVRPKVLQLNTVIDGMSGMLKRLIGEDIQLSVVLDSKLGTLKADPGQMEQIIMNLAVNSRDAMPDGGRLTITTSDLWQATEDKMLKPGRYAVLNVSDSGQGMDAATKAKIFEPFFTTKEQGKGTGLGLSTVYGIVQQYSGVISVNSHPGQGTTFTIHLPCSADDDKPATAAAVHVSRPVSREKIALVEDDESVRKLTMNILSAAGYDIIATADGREILEFPGESLAKIDLLITDVVMREINGPDLVAQLKRTHPELNVLYISGYSDHPLFGRGVLQNISLLQKPYTPDQLLAAVGTALAPR